VGESLQLRGELAILLPDLVLVERLGDERLEAVQLLGVERLLDVVVGALLHRLYGGIHRGLTGDDDALGGNLPLLQLAQQREAVEPRHLQVGEYDAVPVHGELVERLLAVGDDLDAVARVLEDRAEASGDRGFVVRDENLCLLHRVSQCGREQRMGITPGGRQ
jgi:hypothetical protein